MPVSKRELFYDTKIQKTYRNTKKGNEKFLFSQLFH